MQEGERCRLTCMLIKSAMGAWRKIWMVVRESVGGEGWRRYGERTHILGVEEADGAGWVGDGVVGVCMAVEVRDFGPLGTAV